MNKYFYLIVLIVTVHLTGCTSTVDMLHKSENPFYFNPKKAVLIVGEIGDIRIGNISANTNTGIKLFDVPKRVLSHINALAWEIDIGDTFTLLSAEVPLLQSTVEFKKAHSIFIEKSGIYYYGTILTKSDVTRSVIQAVLLKKPLPNLIRLAQKHYPYVFNELKPINFK